MMTNRPVKLKTLLNCRLLICRLLILAGTYLLSSCTNQTHNEFQMPPQHEQATESLITQTQGDQSINQMTLNSDINQLQHLMDQGKLSAVSLTEFYLSQIAFKNKMLNAVITVNPNAIEIAKSLDAERQQGKIRGPLHGIPILIKDNIETKSMPTTAGSLALKNNQPPRDAFIIQQLKEAGAIILGKTNLSEWANFRSENSSSGWSAMGGQTRNPHDLSRSPCGSSSGSGAAVAANLAVAAIGTETNGSITCPASANGIVGLKPTVGRVSRSGIIPISHSQDTAGPMTKFVEDSRLILQVIQGHDRRDKATAILKKTDPLKKTAPLNKTEQLSDKLRAKNTINSLSGLRVGVLSSGALRNEKLQSIFIQLQETLKSHGAVLVDDLKLEPYSGFYRDTYDILLYEFKHDLNNYLATLDAPLNSLTLESLIQFNDENAQQEMPYFTQNIFEKSQKMGPLTDARYQETLAKIQKATQQNGIDRLIKDYELDVIISATLGPAWKIDLLNGDHFTGSFSTYPAVSGYPHLTMPLGKINGMPVGLSITAEALSESKILSVGQLVEKAILRPH